MLVNQKALCNHVYTLQDIELHVLSLMIWAESAQARHCSIKGPLFTCHLLSFESRDLQLGSYHALPHLHLSYIEFQKMLAVALISKREGYGSHLPLSEGTKCRHQKENKKSRAIPKDRVLADVRARSDPFLTCVLGMTGAKLRRAEPYHPWGGCWAQGE